MADYLLWRGAVASLTDIYIHTEDNWGTAQAYKYISQLYQCFEQIAAQQIPWRPIPAEFEISGYFTRSEKHFVYFKELADGAIGIVAVIHQRRHQIARLREAFSIAE